MLAHAVLILRFPPTPRASGKLLANLSKKFERRVRGTIPQAPESAADYKSAPLPIRANPPYQKSDPLQTHWFSLKTGAGIEPDGLTLQGGAPTHTASAPVSGCTFGT